MLTAGAPILLERQAPDFSSCRSRQSAGPGRPFTESDAHGLPARRQDTRPSEPQPSVYLFMMRMKMRMWTDEAKGHYT